MSAELLNRLHLRRFGMNTATLYTSPPARPNTEIGDQTYDLSLHSHFLVNVETKPTHHAFFYIYKKKSTNFILVLKLSLLQITSSYVINFRPKIEPWDGLLTTPPRNRLLLA